MSCTVCPGPNSIPVVNGSTVVVRGATHSGPVMLESLWVIVPLTVGTVAPGVPVVGVVATVLGGITVVLGGTTVVLGGVVVVLGGVVLAPVAVVVPPVLAVAVEPVVVVVVVVGVVVAVPPARLIAAPHAAAAPVLVTNTSVTMRVWPAGTVNAVTAVVPEGTERVISTTLSTVGVSVDVVGEALGVDVVVVVDGVVGVEFWLAAATAASTSRQTASRLRSFMKGTPLEGNWRRQARNGGASDLRGVSRWTVCAGARAAHARTPRRRAGRACRRSGDPRFAIRLADRPW